MYKYNNIFCFIRILNALLIQPINHDNECTMNNDISNTTRWLNAGLMLAHRLRRWANISPALDQRVVFVGKLNKNIRILKNNQV